MQRRIKLSSLWDSRPSHIRCATKMSSLRDLDSSSILFYHYHVPTGLRCITSTSCHWCGATSVKCRRHLILVENIKRKVQCRRHVIWQRYTQDWTLRNKKVREARIRALSFSLQNTWMLFQNLRVLNKNKFSHKSWFSTFCHQWWFGPRNS